MKFDTDLIRRYDSNGPRYTSYPAASNFNIDFDVRAYRKAALLSNQSMTPLTIHVQMPFCRSPDPYCGCSERIARSTIEGDRYAAALGTEIELQAALFSHERRVEQIHFGSGTSTFLSLPQLDKIMQRLRNAFTFAAPEEREVSIEIDPFTTSVATVAGLARLGFDRISLGTREFDTSVPIAADRAQSINLTREIVEAARRHAVSSISLDLIYGLPRQTLRSFEHTLSTVIDIRPTRVAVYGYARIPLLFKAQPRIAAAELPTPTERLQQLRLTIERLTAAGYLYIGMDQFALPHDPLFQAQRNGRLHPSFQGYSTEADCDLIGLGVRSISKLGAAYAQNVSTLREYHERLDHQQLAIARGLELTFDDRVRRDVIQALMCCGHIDLAHFEEERCIKFHDYFASELVRLKPLHADGLVELSRDSIHLTERGRFLARNVAMIFDARLNGPTSAALSKAICPTAIRSARPVGTDLDQSVPSLTRAQ